MDEWIERERGGGGSEGKERLAEIEREDRIHARDLRPRVSSRHAEERYQRSVSVLVCLRESIRSRACICPIHVSMRRFR
jgi:hypothetical protein